MKKEPTEKMCIIKFGWEKYLLPQTKAYQLHALLGDAVKIEEKYVANQTQTYALDMTAEPTVYHARDVIDLTGLRSDDVEAFWKHQEARATLVPKESFKVQTWKEYEENQDDRV